MDAKQGNNSLLNHVLYIPKIIPEANLLFPRLREEVQWQEIMWRQGRKLPRLCAPSIWLTSEIGMLLHAWVREFFLCSYGVNVTISDIFANYYRNGNDYLPHHRDQYDDLHVISLSFGAARTFSFQPSVQKGVTPSGNEVNHTFKLSEGDIIVFDPYTNQHYTHGIAKQPGVKTGRINLTCFVRFDKLPYGLPRLEGEVITPSEVMVRAILQGMK